MNIKTLLAGVAMAACASSALALPISETNFLASGTSIRTDFSVTSAGIFDIYTRGPTIDSVLWLYNASNTLVAANDDGCPFSLCGPAASWSNSLINEISLSIGNYYTVVRDWAESRSGNVEVVIAAGQTDQGRANARLANQVPEPASLALIGLALAGAGVARRRGKK